MSYIESYFRDEKGIIIDRKMYITDYLNILEKAQLFDVY